MNDESTGSVSGESESKDPPTPEIAKIESKIVRTRRKMSATLDELHGKLEPAAIKGQAVEKLHDAEAAVQRATVGRARRALRGAGDALERTGRSLLAVVKRHPVRAALVGIAATWLLLQASNGGALRRALPRSGKAGRTSPKARIAALWTSARQR